MSIPPPPELLADIAILIFKFFAYMYEYICFWNKKSLKWMTLKEKKKIVKEKYLKKEKFLTDTLAKSSQNIFEYSFASEHSLKKIILRK